MTTSDSKYLILSCDGGGIRGLITALLIQELFQKFPSLSNQIYLLAGTSTGGIISLALACNVSPDQLVTLYSTDAGNIFQQSTCMTQAGIKPRDCDSSATPPNISADNGWFDYIVSHIEELFCTWYDNSGLKSAIEAQLKSSATATLNSLVPASPANPRYVLVNTLQLCNSDNVWTPLQLTNLPNIQDNTSGDTLVIDAAMSTSAAPIYFPPYQHPTYGYCADGGLFANNPGTTALTNLVESGIPLENIWMLSLSTGNTLNCYPASAITPGNFGPVAWFLPFSQPFSPVAGQPYTPAIPLMAAFFDATSEVGDYQCGQLLGTRYKRARVPLSQPIELDDFCPAEIKVMTDSTTNYMSTSSEWADIINWITTNFTS